MFASYLVQPLVMAVYVQENEQKAPSVIDSNEDNDETEKIIIVTDAEKENVENLILPLGSIQPTYIALLCAGTGEDSEEHRFIVKQVTDKIDSIDRNITCEHLLQPYVRKKTKFTVLNNDYDIGFEVIIVPFNIILRFDYKTEISHWIILQFKVSEEMWTKTVKNKKQLFYSKKY